MQIGVLLTQWHWISGHSATHLPPSCKEEIKETRRDFFSRKKQTVIEIFQNIFRLFWLYFIHISCIQNTLYLSFNPSIVCTERVEVNLMVCSLRSHILLQYINLKSILALALRMMLRGFGMISLMMYTQLNLSPHSGIS